MDQSQLQDRCNELERRLESIETAVRVFCVALAAVVGTLVFRMFSAAPKFKLIFKDMLGSEDALPAFTKLVLTFSLRAPLTFLLIPIGLTVLAVVMAIRTPRPMALATYGGSMAALTLLWFILAYAFFLPIVKIIHGVAGGP